VGNAHPVELEGEDLFGPRRVPAASSCSDATASTSPIGDSSVPAVERSTAGDPPIFSTPLWSACS
jgi:hypothetical protein